MKVVLASINDIGKYSLEELVKYVDVVGLFAVKERARLYMDISDFADTAKKYNIALFKITDINAKDVEEQMKQLEPDLCMCMGWNQIIRKNILDIPKYGWIGSHPTKLLLKGEKIDPKISSAPGNEPTPYTIRGGYEKTAMSLFWLAQKVDVGDIFAQGMVDVDTQHETTATLTKKLGKVTAGLIRDNMQSILDSSPPRKQQELKNTLEYMKPLNPDDNRIDMSAPIEDTYRLIRSCIYPYPNAFIEFGGQRIYIESTRLENGVFAELKVRVDGTPYAEDSYQRAN